jgi:CubicO group peptidase (beta-lactamase class C family)
VNTYGFLVGELLRRATGHPVGELLARRIADPCAAEFFFGLPRSQHHRVAETLAPDVALTTEEEWAVAFPPTGDPERDRMIWHTYLNPSGFSGMGAVNTAPWREAAIPSTNGHGTARGVAAVYAAFLAGGPPGEHWPGAALRAEAAETHSEGEDRVLGRDSRFGLGFQLAQPGRRPGGSDAAFGHYGYGGTLGFADPECGLAFGYLMNRPGERWNTRRTQRLIDVLYTCL